MHTPCMTAYIFMCLMRMAKESKSLEFVKRFFAYLKNEFFESTLYKILNKLVLLIKISYDASFFKKYISSDGFIQKAYEESLICFCLNGAYKSASLILGKLLSFVLKIFKGSLTAGVFSKLSKKQIFSYSSCVSLFICLMIICPHEAWNNLYGVMAAFGFLAYFMARGFVKSKRLSFKNESFYLVLFVIFVCFSFTYAYDKADALRIVLFLLAAVIFGFILSNSINTKESLISCLKIISAGVFVTSVIGIIQRKITTKYILFWLFVFYIGFFNAYFRTNTTI